MPMLREGAPLLQPYKSKHASPSQVWRVYRSKSATYHIACVTNLDVACALGQKVVSGTRFSSVCRITLPNRADGSPVKGSRRLSLVGAANFIPKQGKSHLLKPPVSQRPPNQGLQGAVCQK